MERVAPIGQTSAPQAATGLPHGRGWAVVATDAGFVLRLLASGAGLRLSEAEVQAIRQGELTGEALMERAGIAALAPPPAPQPPIYGTTVSISTEGRRKAGEGTDGADPARQDEMVARAAVPRAAWMVIGALVLLLAILLGMV